MTSEEATGDRHGVRRNRSRLTAADWARAALAVVAERGLDGVAVEPLAERLGSTKGSFYWHFANRHALLEAALDLWEQEHTEALIAGLEAQPDARARLERLFSLVVDSTRHDRLEVALLATADDPLVAPVVGRVTERRIAYVASLYEELGVAADLARRHAVLAVSVYLGHLQLAHAAPATLPNEPDAWRDHLAALASVIVPGEEGEDGAGGDPAGSR